ncbi:MAG: DUF1934 domain-containing protein [Clostridia bacterium]|nr:DUF1934 domain-containing protein [Clostridia bacterium]
MAHKFMIRIHDVHEYEVEKAETTVYVFGDLELSEESYRITYREESGDLAGCTTTITCIGGKEVSVHREGPFRTDLTMELGRRHSCQYQTEYGSMLMGIFADKVDSHMAETGGYLEFAYNIDFDGDFVSHNILHVTVKETF